MKVDKYDDETVSLTLTRHELATLLKGLSYAVDMPSVKSEITLEELLGCTRKEGQEMGSTFLKVLKEAGVIAGTKFVRHEKK